MGPKSNPMKMPKRMEFRSNPECRESSANRGQTSAGGATKSDLAKSLATANNRELNDPEATDNARGRI